MPSPDPQHESRRSSRAIDWLIALGLAIAGGATVWCATDAGAGFTPDSKIYIEAADNFLAGEGLAHTGEDGSLTPLTHYPPLYSLILSTAALWGQSPADGARVIAIALMAVNLVLFYWLLRRSGLDVTFAALGPLLVLASGSLFTLHCLALSEALFFTLFLMWLTALAAHVRGARGAWLASAAVAAALAVLCRYPGGVLIPATIAVLLWCGRQNLRRAALESAVFGIIAIAPLLAWLGRNLVIADDPVNRTLHFHPPPSDQLLQLLSVPMIWLFPMDYPLIQAVMILVIIGACAALVVWHRKHRRPNAPTLSASSPLPIIAIIFSVIYVPFLIFSVTFVDAETPLDDRLLAPVYFCVLLIVLPAAQHVCRSAPDPRTPRRIACGALSLLLACNAWATAISVRESHVDGIAFNRRNWQRAPMIEYLAALPQDMVIYSNAPELVYLQTGRAAISYPPHHRMTSRTNNPRYKSLMQAMVEALRSEGAVVAHFNFPQYRETYLPTLPQISAQVSLYPAATFDDGAVYRAARP